MQDLEKQRDLCVGTVFFLFLAMFFLGDTTHSAETSRFDTATFTIPDDPSRLVLSVIESRGAGRRADSLSLFADGRLELRKRSGSTVVEERALRLDREETRSILEVAIRHGLAEWDTLAVEAKIVERTQDNRRREIAPPDSPLLTVILRVENYSRGPVELEIVEQKIRLRGPEHQADRPPEIREIQGLSAFANFLRGLHERGDSEP